MAPSIEDPRMMSIHPRIRYNTIGGVNGPLVILDNVNASTECSIRPGNSWKLRTGQISHVQRDCIFDLARRH